MQQQPVHLTLFDLSNSTDWEYVFLSAAERKSAKEGDQGAKGGVDLSDDLKMLSTEGDDHHGVNAGEEDDLILDIPPSWVTKLHIDRATYKKRFVKDCQHVTLYHRAKVEEFAENTHDDNFTMTRDWNKDMTFLESAHATVIPFGFDETCHALSTALLTSSSGDVYSDGIAGRVVFVSRPLTEGQGDFKGLYTDETAWIVLRRATEGSAMVLETYTRLMPVGFKSASETDARGNKFVKVLDKVDEGDVDNIMFERLLLDERQTICL
ncbi:hypothetical protein GQ600_21635 [Phytophthora cactorum]|nr:hypothetical protein GQ600_21635 [Phytophthora cactorum]